MQLLMTNHLKVVRGKNTQLTLGKDLFLKGFDKQLIGVKKNDYKNSRSHITRKFS